MKVAGTRRCVRLFMESFAAMVFIKRDYARVKLRTVEKVYAPPLISSFVA